MNKSILQGFQPADLEQIVTGLQNVPPTIRQHTAVAQRMSRILTSGVRYTCFEYVPRKMKNQYLKLCLR
jgi:hypothetical protein